MTELLFPVDLRVNGSGIKNVSNAASSRSIFTGALRTVGRGGRRWRYSISTQNATDAVAEKERARLKAFAAQLDGPATRFYFSPPGYVQRGSFPATELLTNNTFADGTAGWSTSKDSLSVTDRVLRLITITPAGNVQFFRATTLTQYAPFAMRAMIRDGLGSSSLSLGPSLSAGNNTTGSYSTSLRGLRTVSAVDDNGASQNQFPIVIASTSGFSSGAFVECLYTSIARCALVDNGGNLALYSQDQSNVANYTPSGLNAQPTVSSSLAPDGTLTMYDMVEAVANSVHRLQQSTSVSASAADYQFAVTIDARLRNFALLQLEESAGSTSLNVWFNLTTVAVGTTSLGAGWSNLRTFIVPQGNGLYRCHIVVRKTSAATTVIQRLYTSTGDGVSGFAGDNTTPALSIGWWSFKQSSTPLRYTPTTSAAVAATAQTGSALYVKGLPASTSGLLLPGDLVQVGTQLQQVSASLDSDAAGLGYLQMHRPLRASPADNDPVIVNKPMGLFTLSENENGWSDSPGQFSDFDFVIEESLDQ